MGVQLSTARIIAPSAFLVNFGAQLYGMLSTPSMKEVADKVRRNFVTERKKLMKSEYPIEPLRVLSAPDVHWCILRTSNGLASPLDSRFIQGQTRRRSAAELRTHICAWKSVHW